MVRNLYVAGVLRSILSQLFAAGVYVDWAGGHGVLVRLMRDAEFDFYWQDRYAQNLFARGFEWGADSGLQPATLATAIEVLEHAPDPVVLLEECLAGSVRTRSS